MKSKRIAAEVSPEFAEEMAMEHGDQLGISIVELLHEEELDSEDFEVEGGYAGGADVKPLSGWEPEFTVVESYDKAYELAVERVDEDLREQPELFNQDWLQHYVNTDKLRRVLAEDLRNFEYDELWGEISISP